MVLTMLLIPFWSVGDGVFADEAATVVPDRHSPTTTELSLHLSDTNLNDWLSLSRWTSISRFDQPRVSRITHAHQPLRQVELFGGDRFLAECLNWGSDHAAFRLLNGQTIRVPVVAIANLSNPPGEIDLVDESFEAGSAVERDDTLVRQLDDTTAADGSRSFRLDSSGVRYTQQFEPQLNSARVQFWFRIQSDDETSSNAEWLLYLGDRATQVTPVAVRIESDHQISVSGIAPDTDRSLQTVNLIEGWHLFTALIAPERTRLIVDQAVLASFAGPNRPLQRIDLHATGSKNVLWIDEFQVRKLIPVNQDNHLRLRPIESDAVWTAEGDEVVAQMHDVNRLDVIVETFGLRQVLPWSRLNGLVYRQPDKPIAQLIRPTFGAVCRIVGQPLADRPDCEPDLWYVTICQADSKQVFAQHPMIGEMTFRWSEIRRIEPLFYGESVLLDARQFHLGNSIRTDLKRQQPDGTELRGQFELQQIPVGHPYFVLDVAELEASSPDAPIASPYLAELRAGQLVTEVLINDQRIGDLNSLIRFKSPSQAPQRLRLPIPRDLLKAGANTFFIRQRPLKVREYDDSELGKICLEFDLESAR